MAEQPLQASVVIPAYNASQTIGECLTALASQTVPSNHYEVIVVDDGSTDDTAAVAARLGARVLRQANAGPAAARNHGVSVARSEVILFTDADCAPAPDWIEEMLAPLADLGITGTKGVYRTRQRSLAARFIQIEYEDRYDHTAKHTYIDFVDTYAAAYRRSALLDSGGFSTRFPFASVEDQELSFRLARAGHRLVFNPQAVVYHQHPESWGHYARRKFKIGYWKTLVLRWHPDKTWRDSHTPSSLKLQMVLAALSAPLAVLSLFARAAVPWLALDLGVFVASALPFVRKAWRRDRPLAWLSVPVLYLRAWSLGLGLVAGSVATLLRRGPLVTGSD